MSGGYADEQYLYLIINYSEEPYKVYVDVASNETKKLERYDLNVDIYSGDLNISELNDADIKFWPWKKYLFDLTINGDKYFIESEFELIAFTAHPGIRVPMIFDTSDYIFYATPYFHEQGGDVVILNSSFCESNTVIINAIYEIGKVTNCIEENGCVACYSDADGWVLCEQGEDNIIPQTINGIEIDGIYYDTSGLNRSIIINKPIRLYNYGEYSLVLEEIKVTTPDIDFLSVLPYYITIDLSECGNNITIPTELIENRVNAANEGKEIKNIYVTEAAKSLYEEYSFVVTK